ncbi:MAG TPA: hypothetical protein VFB34_07675 [Chloroflexota bacterium]|nr:hypothetical protein [Chloroflexota bacterium]
MSDENEWRRQLLGAVLAAAARTAVEYATNPKARDESVEEMKSKLADIDYNALAKVLSRSIDQMASAAKAALNEAIDNIQDTAEEAVEAAAEKAQSQLGSKKRGGKGKLFLGLLLGVVAGFFLLNEDRRNQLMDKLTGASGPIDNTQIWTPPAPSSPPPASSASTPPASTSTAPPATPSQGQSDEQRTDSIKAVTEDSVAGASSGAQPKTESSKAKESTSGSSKAGETSTGSKKEEPGASKSGS